MTPLDRLSQLSQREREVLRLRCGGTPYEVIGNQLHIGVSTVKNHMSHIYVKLGIDQLPQSQRLRQLYEVYCTLLQDVISRPPPSEPGEPEPMTDSLEQMVEEDEKALVLYTPPRQANQPPLEPPALFVGLTQPIRNSRMSIYLVTAVFLLGVAVTTIVFLLLNQTPTDDAVTAPELTQESVPTIIESQTVTRLAEGEITVAPSTPSPQPTRTPSPDTLPGTILGPGNVWYQGGMEMALRNSSFVPGCGGFFGFELVITNNTSSELVVDISGTDFSITDDFNQPYSRVWFKEGASEQFCYSHTLSQLDVNALEAGEQLDFAFRILDEPSPRASRMIVIVYQAGRIENAQWEILIPR